ncbi:MAG: cyclic nucleotide-binding domain-containing protein [Candidatus Schekmanbacteria bacterium]|nr:cyclic nucleotide-binding domain-containing protein [Candidatus Schekmanbacteria bacterium]
MLKVSAWAGSHKGRVRTNNEDSYLVNEEVGLFAVADGVGGGNAGEVASQLAVRSVDDFFVTARERLVQHRRDNEEIFRRRVLAELSGALREASGKIFAKAAEDFSCYGMATTMDLLLILEEGAFIGHVGDSRVYLVRADKVYQLTEDHSVGQRLVKSGRLKSEDLKTFPYRNVIERSLGPVPAVQPDTFWVNVEAGDLFVLCSDGLSDFVTPNDIRTLVQSYRGKDLVVRLIRLANQRGGGDNITVVLVEPENVRPAMRNGPLDWTMRVEHLRGVFLFNQMSDQELLRVLRCVYEEHRRPGAIIIREGEPGDRFHILVQGTAEVTVSGVLLQTMRAGQHFGELALVDNSPRSATVTALDAVHLLTIKRNDLLELLESDAEIARKLLWAFLGNVTERLRSVSHQLADKSRPISKAVDVDATLPAVPRRS